MDAAAMLARLCAAGPLLYIGILMAVDPAGLVAWLESPSEGVRRAMLHLTAQFRWPPPPRGRAIVVSPGARAALRLAGVVLILLSLLHLVGPPAFC